MTTTSPTPTCLVSFLWCQKETYLQKYCHFWLIHELDSWLNQLWYILQVIRILFDQGTDMFQFLPLGSSNDLGHLILPLFQDAIQVIKLLTKFLFLFFAAFLLVGLANVRKCLKGCLFGEFTWTFWGIRKFIYLDFFFFSLKLSFTYRFPLCWYFKNPSFIKFGIWTIKNQLNWLNGSMIFQSSVLYKWRISYKLGQVLF